MLAAVAVKNKKESSSQAENDDYSHYKRRRSELPLYAPLHSYNKPKRIPHPSQDSAARQTLENGIRRVRCEVQQGYDAVSKQLDVLNTYYQTAKAHTSQSIDYLNQPHNILPRTGAIAVGGLAGFIFAARGGFFKKVLYTSFGAGAIASLCYPRQAEAFACDALYEARKGYAIAYNFVKGVKPGEGMIPEPINKFPTNLQDVKFLAYDLYDEAKDALFPKKN